MQLQLLVGACASRLVNSACGPGMSGCVGSGGVRDVLRVGVPFTGLYPGAGPEGPSLCGRGGGVGCGVIKTTMHQVLFQEAGSRLRQREEPRRRAFGREAGFDINGGTSRQWSTRGRRGMGMRRLLASRRHGAHDGIASSCADARVVCVSALARACSMSHSGPKCWQHRVVRPVECP